MVETIDTKELRRLADWHYALADTFTGAESSAHLHIANQYSTRWLLLHNADPMAMA